MFAYIQNISDILPHIENKKEFYVFDKGEYSTVNYVMNDSHTFEADDGNLSPHLLECRGIKFCNKTGNILVRPYHKFFNVGENIHSTLDKYCNRGLYYCLDKIDGCLDGETTLTTPDEILTIRELCERNYKGLVWGHNHKLNTDEWVCVFGTMIQDNIDNWYEIEFENGIKLKLTDNHKIWCINRNQYLTCLDLLIDDEVLLQSSD